MFHAPFFVFQAAGVAVALFGFLVNWSGNLRGYMFLVALLVLAIIVDIIFMASTSIVTAAKAMVGISFAAKVLAGYFAHLSLVSLGGKYDWNLASSNVQSSPSESAMAPSVPGSMYPSISSIPGSGVDQTAFTAAPVDPVVAPDVPAKLW
jgi:hypothetical protein